MSLMYKKTIQIVDKFVPGALRPIWVHPAGMEGCLVIDYSLHKTQNHKLIKLVKIRTIYMQLETVETKKRYSIRTNPLLEQCISIKQALGFLVAKQLDKYSQIGNRDTYLQ